MWFSMHGGVQSKFGLDDLGDELMNSLLQTYLLYDSMNFIILMKLLCIVIYI